jgi:hypothetical protein
MKLIIVQRSKPDTYQRLREQFAGERDVKVILERRQANREHDAVADQARTPSERRRLKKDFEGRDFVVVYNTDPFAQRH